MTTAKFKHLETTVHSHKKKRLNSANICYHSVQDLLAYSPLPKKAKIKICKTIVLPVVSYGCETRSLAVMGDRQRSDVENIRTYETGSNKRLEKIA
jgi:hypothetical protein